MISENTSNDSYFIEKFENMHSRHDLKLQRKFWKQCP